MKKILLTIISILIIVLSVVLIYHVTTDGNINVDQMIYGENIALSDLSSEIDEVIINIF